MVVDKKLIIRIAEELIGENTIIYSNSSTGSSPETGFDCSGFVQYVLKKAQIPILNPYSNKLLRHSEEFFDHLGIQVHSGRELLGDLVFFSKNYARPTHIGIYIGNGDMIHAATTTSQKIEKIKIDEYIRNLDLEQSINHPLIYSSNPIGFKRITTPSKERFQF